MGFHNAESTLGRPDSWQPAADPCAFPDVKSPSTSHWTPLAPSRSPWVRLVVLGYGSLAYLGFLGILVLLVLFLQELFLPATVSRGPRAVSAGGSALAWAVALDVGLIAAFGVVHSVMAREAFKRRWVRVVPSACERSTFVLTTVVLLGCLIAFWRPLPGTVWEVHGPAAMVLTVASWAGWSLAVFATFAVDHAHLFGLQQVWRYFRGQVQLDPPFRVRWFYRYLRHPLYLGFLTAFWATPTLSSGRFLLAALMTAYVLIAIRFEERDLVARHGEPYRQYRSRVPMLLPRSTPRRIPLPATRRAPTTLG